MGMCISCTTDHKSLASFKYVILVYMSRIVFVGHVFYSPDVCYFR